MKRFDRGYIFYHALTDLVSTVVLAFVAFTDFMVVEDSEGEFVGIDYSALPFMIVGACLLFLGLTVYRFLFVRTSGYSLDATELRCKKGVFFRKNSILEYKKIHAVNKKQNILQRIFGIAVLTVDSGSANTSAASEISIVEKSLTVDSLIEKIKALKDSGEQVLAEEVRGTVTSEQTLPLYSFASKKKLLYSLINLASVSLLVFCIGIVGSVLFTSVTSLLKVDWLSGIGEALVKALAVTLILVLISAIITLLSSIIYSFIGYYNFRVSRNKNDIEISYGLLVLHKNTFSYDRIKAVKICQGLVMRMLGFAYIQVEVIGYHQNGDDETSSGVGMLIPFCKISEADGILRTLLPDFVPERTERSARALFPFISWTYLIFSLIYLSVSGIVVSYLLIFDIPSKTVGVVAIALLICYAAVLCTILVSAILNYKSSKITVSAQKITVSCGGFFKKISVFKRSALTSVESVSTPMRNARGIASYVLHLKTNSTSNKIKVGIQDADTICALEEFMKY